MNDKEKKAIEKIEKQILIGECEKAIGVPIYISDLKIVLNLIEKQKTEIEKKDRIINEYEKECRQFKAFCKRVRRDEKHDVDLFNQGQEQKCNQFLNLISGEPHWSYEGKYFDDTDNQIEQYFEKKAEEEK